MPRSKFTVNPERPYHISGRCRNKDWFDIPIAEVWVIMENHLYFLSKAFGITIHAFVLMDNHFHLMASSPQGNLSQGMQYFMGATSRDIQKLSGRINQVWGSRFFRSELDSYWSYVNCYKYTYRNPVEAKLCKEVESYPFSSLSGLLGLRSIYFPVESDSLIFEDAIEETLSWLNSPPVERDLASVRAALKHPVFKLPKVNQRKNKLLEDRM